VITTGSFCTIPRARGESRSVSPDLVLAEAASIAEAGYREIVLTGVNVGTTGKRSAQNLLGLLRGLIGIDGIERIRVSSIEPNLLNDALLEFWLAEPKMCKHFHIPLQSGSDAVLAAMRRRYRASWYDDGCAASSMRIRELASAQTCCGISGRDGEGFRGDGEVFGGSANRLHPRVSVFTEAGDRCRRAQGSCGR